MSVLAEEPVLVINGFFPGLTMKEVLILFIVSLSTPFILKYIV